MKNYMFLMLLLMLFSTSSHSDANRLFPEIKGPLLGQQPPGLVAEPFAPGIISKEGWEVEGVFAPGMQEFYFVTNSGKGTPIMVIGLRRINNVWKKYIEFKRQGEISFSPDGQRMYMADGYMDRVGDGWSERKSLGPMFDREDWGIMRLTASAKGTYVFDDYKSNDVIRISKLKGGERQAPKALGPVVNTGKWTAHPYIAPDESYLIWDSEREGGFGDSDLYISFRQSDGTWGPAINMGDQVNSAGWDAFAAVTPDGKYILFNRKLGETNESTDIYWVDAKLIDTLREQHNNHAPEATAAKVEALVTAVTDAEDFDLFVNTPVLKEAFMSTAPTDRKDGLLVGELGLDGGNKAMLLKLAKEIAEKKHGNYDSLLITHRGKLLFESYYRRGRINLPHGQASATKTYTGLVLGRAIQLGYLSLSDLDKPLISFLQGLEPSKFIEGAEKITLYQALTMTTGIRINDENKEKMQENSIELTGQKHVQAMFELSEPITAESQKFAYSAGPHLVMQVIDAAVPGTAKDFIKHEFFDKMGITTYGWLDADSGLPGAGSSASITSRDMVKLGMLAMNKGRWKGEQLIPATYIKQATSRINHAAKDIKVFGGGKDVLDQGYGFFWWSADLKVGSKSYFSTSAQGGGGQFIILIEALDLIVVASGHERHPATLQLTAERVIPAFLQKPL